MPPIVHNHWTNSPYPRLRLRRFEKYRLRQLLKALNLETRLPEFWDDSTRNHQEPHFTFDSLRRVFPTFPWRLVATTFFHPSTSRRMWIDQWFHHPLENFVVDKYQEYLANSYRDGAEEEADRPLGMIFSLDRRVLIIHNGPRQNRGPLFGNHFIINDQLFECWIERYDFWLEAVARSRWTPTTPFVPPQERLITLDDRPGAWVAPWMMVCCEGPGPDSTVLAWLCRILLTDPTPPYEFDFLNRHEGERCVDATHEEIAAELPPLSSRQVKEALARLRKLGLITTDQTRIRLVEAAIENAQRHCDGR